MYVELFLILCGVCRAIFGRNRDTVGSGESLLSRRFALERVPWEGKGTDGAVLGCKVVAQKLFNNVVRFPKLPHSCTICDLYIISQYFRKIGHYPVSKVEFQTV